MLVFESITRGEFADKYKEHHVHCTTYKNVQYQNVKCLTFLINIKNLYKSLAVHVGSEHGVPLYHAPSSTWNLAQTRQVHVSMGEEEQVDCDPRVHTLPSHFLEYRVCWDQECRFLDSYLSLDKPYLYNTCYRILFLD